MTNKNSDYTKKRINLNDYLPTINKDAFVESLNENIFNRFLTKADFDHIVGLIGYNEVDSPTDRRIREQSAFKQDNQLQPVVSRRVGAADHFMSFEDFMRRLDRMGVNTDKFDEWGDALHFNYAPPIDIDKLINYRNYYWNTNGVFDNTPQYVTIKDQVEWASTRYNKVLRNVFDAVNTYTAVSATLNSVTLQGNLAAVFNVDSYIILETTTGDLWSSRVTDSSFSTASKLTTLTVSTSLNYAPVRIASFIIKSTTGSNNITVQGDLSGVMISEYPFGAYSSDGSLHLMTVTSSEYIPVLDRTTITVAEMEAGQSFNAITLHPLVAVMLNQLKHPMEYDRLYSRMDDWVDEYIGADLSHSRFIILSGNTGSTEMQSNTITDNYNNFALANVTVGDNVVVYSEKCAGIYTITNVSANTITVDTSDPFFTTGYLHYAVFREFNPSSETQPDNAYVGQLWNDTLTNTVKQYNGNQWVTRYYNSSILTKYANPMQFSTARWENPWSLQNEWVHRSAVQEFTGMVKAQMPIIEFEPYIELAQTSFSTKEWRYRANTNTAYVKSSINPTMLELHNITKTTTGINSEFTIVNTTTIKLHHKFGNIANEVTPNTRIRLDGFDSNNGIYQVIDVQFVQPSPTSRFETVLTLGAQLPNVNDAPLGARILPELTSNGDPFISLDEAHWQFAGVKEIRSASLLPERNAMHSSIVSSFTYNGIYESKLGLNWQSFALSDENEPQFEPIITFHQSLHDLVLYDDYQEGDLRVYLNGVRQYGSFEDIGSSVQEYSDYVGGIKLVNTYLTSGDVLRVELGEYAQEDVGKRAITVNTAAGNQLYNLTNIRLIEQTKSEVNQYPHFAIANVHGERLSRASEIFKFTESEDSPLNLNILRRIVKVNDDYSFQQLLSDSDTNEIFMYFNAGSGRTIWKHGLNYEKYVPQKGEDFWELAYQWYYNNSHELRKDIKLTQLYKHFRSILEEQEFVPEFNSQSAHLIDAVNYGVGGTIKEFNDGFDTLMSAVFVNNGDPIAVIQFAHDQYTNSINYLKESFIDDVHKHIADSNGVDTKNYVIRKFIEEFENNDMLKRQFGDSSSFNTSTGTGIKNWVATTPIFNLMPSVKPYTIKDEQLGIHQLMHHDGHRSNIGIPPAIREQMFNRIKSVTVFANQTVVNDSVAFPTMIDNTLVEDGWVVIRTNSTTLTRKLYIYDSTKQWVLIDLSDLYGDLLLHVEELLYIAAVYVS